MLTIVLPKLEWALGTRCKLTHASGVCEPDAGKKLKVKNLDIGNIHKSRHVPLLLLIHIPIITDILCISIITDT